MEDERGVCFRGDFYPQLCLTMSDEFCRNLDLNCPSVVLCSPPSPSGKLSLFWLLLHKVSNSKKGLFGSFHISDVIDHISISGPYAFYITLSYFGVKGNRVTGAFFLLPCSFPLAAYAQNATCRCSFYIWLLNQTWMSDSLLLKMFCMALYHFIYIFCLYWSLLD